MSVEEIKRGLELLSKAQQDEVSAFLFHLRRSHDSDYQKEISARLADRDPANWLTLDEFERRLGQKED